MIHIVSKVAQSDLSKNEKCMHKSYRLFRLAAPCQRSERSQRSDRSPCPLPPYPRRRNASGDAPASR